MGTVSRTKKTLVGLGGLGSTLALATLVVATSAASAGCGSGIARSAASRPAPAVGSLWVTVPAAPGWDLEAEVTGIGMESPIAAPLTVSGLTATARIDGVDAGPGRQVQVTALGPTGETCSFQVAVEVSPRQVTKVDGPIPSCVTQVHQTASAEDAANSLSPVAVAP